MGWLSWRWGAGGALVALMLWPLLGGWLKIAVREFGIISALYALWNLGGRIRAFGVDQAFDRGEQLWNFQQAIYLPSEKWMQDMILPFPWIVRSANVFYALAHVPVFVWALVYVFWKHRSHFTSFRTQMALFTGTSLLVQLIAVAPPRFVEATGMVDTGILYNQSVYSALGREAVGQLQAMPSIHVGWALYVGIVTYRFADSAWLKWLGVSHAVITMWVVMVTANHFWMDGIVAAGIMGFWYLVLRLIKQRGNPSSAIVSDNEVGVGGPVAVG